MIQINTDSENARKKQSLSSSSYYVYIGTFIRELVNATNNPVGIFGLRPGIQNLNLLGMNWDNPAPCSYIKSPQKIKDVSEERR
jgi:hypothetical protein